MLVVLVAVGVYAIRSRPGPALPHPAPALMPCEPDRTVGLRIAGKADELATQRDAANGGWSLTRPRPGPGDATAIEGLLNTLSQLRPIESLAGTAPGQDLGLEPPAATISCSLRSGASYTLSVGGQSFDGNGHYARVGGDPKLYVIPAAEVSRFQKALEQPPFRPSPIPSGAPSPSPST